MFLVTGLAKLFNMDPSAMDAKDVLKMATVNGAKAMGLDDADTLEVGKFADMILIDLNKPNMRPIHSIEKNLVYAGSKDNIILTMVNGKILYENGKFYVGEDENEIYKKCQLLAEKLANNDKN
jgi:5-methylthioadenosine/S-adenosylhomocysteine deaminase